MVESILQNPISFVSLKAFTNVSSQRVNVQAWSGASIN
jgi:hypothetical protein